MKYEQITVSLKRDIRLAKYNISQVKVSFSVRLEEGDDHLETFDEVHKLAVDAIEEMEKIERTEEGKNG